VRLRSRTILFKVEMCHGIETDSREIPVERYPRIATMRR